LPHHRFSRPAP